MKLTRRTFILQSIATAGLVAAGASQAADAPMVAETDPQATALGYVAVATKADKVKFPKYAAGQHCGSCALYQGKEGEAAGGCLLFAGKRVAANGWCSGYNKKAG